MGLDWCLKDRVVEGQEHNKAFAEAHCERINKQIDEEYQTFLKREGVEAPSVFPNEVTDSFRETDIFKKLHDELGEWKIALDASTVSPLKTLGCPAIGEDSEATEWAVNYYNEIKEEYDAMKTAGKESHQHEKFMLNFPDAEAYVKANTGLMVPSLAKKPEGLGSVTGIAVGPESFRGKVLRYIPWLDEDLVGESYNDHEPDELLDYGERLLEAAEDKEKELGETKTEEEEEQVTTLKEAAQWCIFWGREGHAMHAWY